jgi:hypothetical protein
MINRATGENMKGILTKNELLDSAIAKDFYSSIQQRLSGSGPENRDDADALTQINARSSRLNVAQRDASKSKSGESIM